MRVPMLTRFKSHVAAAHMRRLDAKLIIERSVQHALRALRQPPLSEWQAIAGYASDLVIIEGLQWALSYLRSEADLVRQAEYLKAGFLSCDLEWPGFDAVPWVVAHIEGWQTIDPAWLVEWLAPVDELGGWSWCAHENKSLLALVRDDGGEAYVVPDLDGPTVWSDVIVGLECAHYLAEEN